MRRRGEIARAMQETDHIEYYSSSTKHSRRRSHSNESFQLPPLTAPEFVVSKIVDWILRSTHMSCTLLALFPIWSVVNVFISANDHFSHSSDADQQGHTTHKLAAAWLWASWIFCALVYKSIIWKMIHLVFLQAACTSIDVLGQL
jgi:hypothetical protein